VRPPQTQKQAQINLGGVKPGRGPRPVVPHEAHNNFKCKYLVRYGLYVLNVWNRKKGTLAMPAKLADDIKRTHVNLPTALADHIDQWRGGQPGVPNFSEAIRRLVELGLEASKKASKAR
jgi:hypothetical protein